MSAAVVETHEMNATHQLSSSITTRFLIYFLIIFTPLARGGAQPWTILLIHLVTLLGLTTVLVRKQRDQIPIRLYS